MLETLGSDLYSTSCPEQILNLSESQTSHLPIGFIFPNVDTSDQIALQSVPRLTDEFERKKTNKQKLSTDISFPYVPSYEGRCILVWSIPCGNFAREGSAHTKGKTKFWT